MAEVNFKSLCTGGVKGYCFHPISIRKNFHRSTPFRSAVEALVYHVENILKEIEDGTKRRISKFIIGKSHVKGSSKLPDAESRKSLMQRWSSYKSQKYDGLIVICIIKKSMLPESLNGYFRDQELFSIAIEQQLIHHFAYNKCDNRLANTTLETGRKALDDVHAGLCYVAYKLHDGPICNVSGLATLNNQENKGMHKEKTFKVNNAVDKGRLYAGEENNKNERMEYTEDEEFENKNSNVERKDKDSDDPSKKHTDNDRDDNERVSKECELISNLRVKIYI